MGRGIWKGQRELLQEVSSPPLGRTLCRVTVGLACLGKSQFMFLVQHVAFVPKVSQYG